MLSSLKSHHHQLLPPSAFSSCMMLSRAAVAGPLRTWGGGISTDANVHTVLICPIYPSLQGTLLTQTRHHPTHCENSFSVSQFVLASGVLILTMWFLEEAFFLFQEIDRGSKIFPQYPNSVFYGIPTSIPELISEDTFRMIPSKRYLQNDTLKKIPLQRYLQKDTLKRYLQKDIFKKKYLHQKDTLK